jgi:predicted extracellular nuclease
VIDPPPPAPVGQPLPFSQDWNNTSLITADHNWSGVPGIVGYRGDELVTATGVDPQTIVIDGSATPINVEANETNPNTFNTGGVAEFHIPDPTIALNGSGTADAPHIVLNVDTTGHSGIVVAYNLRDLDGSADDAIQRVALQFRVGNAGNYENVPAGFVADATDPTAATRVTPVVVTLPPSADNQPLVQVRIITTNAAGNDEWVGIDDIHVFDNDASTPPTGVGSATPGTVDIGGSSLLTVSVTPGSNPASFTHVVTLNLSPIGGSSAQPLFDDGVNGGDVVAGDNVFSFTATVPNGTTTGQKTLTGTVLDTFGRSSITSISLTVTTPPQLVAIHEIQGSGQFSPFATQTVTTTGIVTARKFNGFFIQAPDGLGDNNPSSSEGVFVFTSSAPPATAEIGNEVRVTGTVQEFVPGADPFQFPLTEITSPSVVVLSGGNILPAPVVLSAADTSPAGALDQLERYEGMRVQVHSLLITAGTGGNVNEPNATATSDGLFFGVVPPNPRPLREPGIHVFDPLPPGSPATVTRFDGNPELIRVDSDALLGAPRIDVTAGEIAGPIVGPLDYGFRTYTILPEPGTPIVVNETVMPTPVSEPTANQFTVAAYNLERFFDDTNAPGLGEPVLTATAFGNRLNKLSLVVRDILRTPDILAVEEAEDLSTLQRVAAKVNADAVAGGQADPNYTAHLVEGNDVGGIDVGFLVKSARVTVVDVVQVGADATFTNPNNNQQELLNDRPPLMLRAIVEPGTGATFPITVIANHLRSLIGAEELTPDGNRVRAKRRAQAEFLAGFIQDRQQANPNEHIITVGDYNAFQFNDGYVDSIGTIQGAPTPANQVVLASGDLVNPDLFNLIETVAADQRYSYVFDGNAQAIDHALVTQNLRPRLDKLEFGRVGADFAEAARNNPNTPTRLSDHDPLVAFFNIPPPPRVTISDASVVEGDAGTTAASFVVRLSAPSGQTVIVNFGTTDGAAPNPASEDSDYSRVTGTLVFAPGTTTQQITVLVNGDVVTERNETFLVNLSAATNAVIEDGQGIGTIINDDPLPKLSIDDVTVQESASADVDAEFTVRLSHPSQLPVTVKYLTIGFTAVAGKDFVGVPPTTIVFAPGQTTATARVTIKRDRTREPRQAFFVLLLLPVQATLRDPFAVGTILDAPRDPKRK